MGRRAAGERLDVVELFSFQRAIPVAGRVGAGLLAGQTAEGADPALAVHPPAAAPTRAALSALRAAAVHVGLLTVSHLVTTRRLPTAVVGAVEPERAVAPPPAQLARAAACTLFVATAAVHVGLIRVLDPVGAGGRDTDAVDAGIALAVGRGDARASEGDLALTAVGERSRIRRARVHRDRKCSRVSVAAAAHGGQDIQGQSDELDHWDTLLPG